jgi:hypothetical protein
MKEGRSGVSPTFSQLAVSLVLSLGRSGSVLPWKPSNFQQESPINYQKCPNYEKTKKRRQRFQYSSSFDSPKTDEQIHVKNAVVKAEAKTVAY